MSCHDSGQQILGGVLKHLLLRASAPSPSLSTSQPLPSSEPFLFPPPPSDIAAAWPDFSTCQHLSSSSAAGAGGGISSVYFVSVQPCFDKKLEASRRDFYHSAEGLQEVRMRQLDGPHGIHLTLAPTLSSIFTARWTWSYRRPSCGI